MVTHKTNLSSAVLLCIALCGGVNAQTKPDAKPGESAPGGSIVTGRVIYDDTGQPAARHRVQLIAAEALARPPGSLRIPTVITNDNGEFSLQRIATGEYYVFAQPVDDHKSAQSFPLLQSGDSAADAAKLEQFRKSHIKIKVDSARNVEVVLQVPNPHFGSISGSVVDAFGKPAARSFVHLMNRGENDWGASVLTDEQGRYRFPGLPAGEYTISANPPAKEAAAEEKIRRFEGQAAATYFPSTLDPNSSPAVTVIADRDTDDVQIKLIARKLYTLAGSVQMRSNSQPVSNARLRLTKNEVSDKPSVTSTAADVEGAMFNYLSSTDKNGHWLIANVPDGDYRLTVQSMPGELSKPRFVQEQRDLAVNGSDIDDLVIKVSEGGRVSGVVNFENDQRPRYTIVDASRANNPANCSARIDDDGKFVLTGVPAGEITLRALPSPRDKFYVKSIEANGLDLLRSDLTIADGEEIKDVHIVISSNVAVVTGRVLSRTGDQPVVGVNVMLHRVSGDKQRSIGGRLQAVTNQTGDFEVSAPPGAYLVLVWRNEDGPSALGNALKKAEREQQPVVTLSAAERKQLDIRLP